jgi:hypothetical protein
VGAAAAQLGRYVESSLEEWAAFGALRVTAVQPGSGALGEQLRQPPDEEVDRFGANNEFGAIVDDRRRTRRVEKMEEVDEGDFRTDDEAARRQEDSADVAQRREAVAAAAVRRDYLDMGAMVGEEAIDVGAREAAFARQALVQVNRGHARLIDAVWPGMRYSAEP